MIAWAVLGASIAALVYLVQRQGGVAQLAGDAGALVSGVEADLTDLTVGQVSGGALGQAVDLIAGFESFSAHAYEDPRGSGKYSIGYGHQIRPGDPYDSTSVISESEARALLQQDATAAYTEVTSDVQVQLSDGQLAALTSLAYNIGLAAFRNSTLLRDLNQGDYQNAADQFGVWIHAGGEISSDLQDRRAQEAALFEQDIPGGTAEA